MLGNFVVISGFSGVGKGTLVNALLKKNPDDFALSISATSRAPRVGEADGREYFFKTREEFDDMVAQDAFLEHAYYNNQGYGTPKKYVTEQLALGKNVILEIDVQGGLQVKKKFPETILVFILPPHPSDLKTRLLKRGTETPENIQNRLKRAYDEASYIASYDVALVNDDFETCLNELEQVIRNHEKKEKVDAKFVAHFKEDLKKVLEE